MLLLLVVEALEQVVRLLEQEMRDQIVHLVFVEVQRFILPKAAVELEQHHLQLEALEVQVVALEKAQLPVELQHNRVNQATVEHTDLDMLVELILPQVELREVVEQVRWEQVIAELVVVMAEQEKI
tara:strand:- start:260 stop:637 length:378 start_codon:yes stop_codon:yes gene_type:complete